MSEETTVTTEAPQNVAEVAPVVTEPSPKVAPAETPASPVAPTPSILSELAWEEVAPVEPPAETPAEIPENPVEAPKETQVETPVEPIVFDDFTVPEGFTYDAEKAALFTGLMADYAKEFNLTKEQAQKLGQDLITLHAAKLTDQVARIQEEVNAQVAAIRGEHEALVTAANERDKAWETASLEEFGKQRETVIASAKAGAKAFLQDGEATDFFAMLKETRAGNHPLMIRYLNRVGEAVAKQAVPVPGSSSETKLDKLTALYGPPKTK